MKYRRLQKGPVYTIKMLMNRNVNFTACWMENGAYKFHRVDRYKDIYSIYIDVEKDDTEGRTLPYHMHSELMSLEQFEYSMACLRASLNTHYKFVKKDIKVHLSPADEYRVLIEVYTTTGLKLYIPVINIPGYGSLVHPECVESFRKVFGTNNIKVIEFFGYHARNYID